mmetsp:Transcript_8767/g.21475  ORF Transcript_8767/g.21475 Transcript_8767/m.21475 type:complete len:434 (+) Transcript_8767:138-1439(+)
MIDTSTERKEHEQELDENSRYGGEAWTKIVSASIGSAITAFTVTPLDVVKVRQQAAGLTPGGTAVAQGTVTSLPPNASVSPCPRGCGTFVLNTGLGEYLTSRNKAGYFDPKTGALKQEKPVAEVLKTGGPFRIIRSIFIHEGLAGIYAGLAPTLVMGIPNTVLYFYTYEELAERLNERYPSSHPSDTIPAIAGASARFVASLSTAPLELLRTRQAARAGFGASNAANHSEGRGMISEFRSIIRNEGAISLFRGVRPTLMRDVPFSAIYWVCIENLRDFWKSRRRNISPSSNVSTTEQSIEALINGSVSGVIAAAFTTPLDVLKTRSQIEGQMMIGGKTTVERSVGVAPNAICDHGGALSVHPKCSPFASSTVPAGDSGSTKTLSTMKIARNIIEEDGIAGLWRGNIARCMKVAPACGIMIATYEAGKRILSVE